MSESKIAIVRRPLLIGVPLAVALVALCACGGSSKTAATGDGPVAASGVPAGQGGNRTPSTSGEVVAISGSTLQVQSTSAQTAVSYSASTTFTSTATATAAALKVGSCVSARPASGATTSTTAVAAATVLLSSPVNGVCTGGFGGFGGGTRPSGVAPSGAPGGGAPPSGAPTGARPSGAGGPGGGFGTTGKITSISGSSFVVAATTRQAGSGSSSSSSPTSVTVTTTAGTTYSQTVKSTSAALVIGKCVTAQGKADDTGAVAATSIAVRAKQNGSCSTAGGPGA